MEENSSPSESGPFEYLTTRQASIFLVDASLLMFQDAEDGKDCPFVMCLKSIHGILCNKILAAEQDLFSVILFGTSSRVVPDRFDENHPESVCVLHDLHRPEDETILSLESLWEYEKFEILMTSSGEISLSHALQTCSTVFAKAK